MSIIFQRRSIRKYTNQTVEEEKLHSLLSAGMSAPSAANQRPWQFILMKDRNNLDELSYAGPYSGMLKEAMAAIVVCGDLTLETRKGMWVQDCSAAAQNILLHCVELGLGSVWVGVYPREERMNYVIKALGLPAHIIPLCIIPIGYPAEQKETPDRYDADRVHPEKW
ncbi:MAG: nitroreductase family protein [Bacteroidetes bacterium]|nr:nitroreductase family protein [Bacteroidota bacterium]